LKTVKPEEKVRPIRARGQNGGAREIGRSCGEKETENREEGA